MQEVKKINNTVKGYSEGVKWKGWYLLIFLFVVLLLAGAYWVYQSRYAVAYTIELEVNPAVELQLNRDGRVVHIDGENAEGEDLLRNLDLIGNDEKHAVDTLLTAMLKQGYLSAEENAVLVTVQHDNPVKQAQIQETLVKEIEDTLRASSVKADVLSPDFNDQAEIQQKADSLQISAGKMALIQQIIAQDNQLQAEDLAELHIHDLGLILDSFHPASSKIELPDGSGSSEKDYIGHEKALQLACNAAGVNQNQVEDFSIEFDVDNGRMLYEVEFIDSDIAYDYDLDAIDGAVISQQQKKKQANRVEQQAVLSHSEALAVALQQAELEEKQVQVWKNHLHEEDNLPVYEVEFADAAYEYAYTIQAKEGNVLQSQRKQLQTVTKNMQDKQNDSNAKQATTDIGESQAKSLALQHAGFTENEIQKLNLKQTKEHGRNVYEVEFHAEQVEYEYQIDASTGEIIKFEQES